MAYFTAAAVLIAARIRVYVPQRQMLPSIALSIWVSVGLGVFLSRAAACMIWPLWQYPHWATWCVSQATWHGCAPFALRPSMVVILFPAAALRGVTQLRIASPFKWTVQAPHNPMPHPISSAFPLQRAWNPCGIATWVIRIRRPRAGNGHSLPHILSPFRGTMRLSRASSNEAGARRHLRWWNEPVRHAGG